MFYFSTFNCTSPNEWLLVYRVSVTEHFFCGKNILTVIWRLIDPIAFSFSLCLSFSPLYQTCRQITNLEACGFHKFVRLLFTEALFSKWKITCECNMCLSLHIKSVAFLKTCLQWLHIFWFECWNIFSLVSSHWLSLKWI